MLPHHWGCISSVSERDLADLYSRTRQKVIQFPLRVARRELPIKEHAAKHPKAIHPEIRGGEKCNIKCIETSCLHHSWLHEPPDLRLFYISCTAAIKQSLFCNQHPAGLEPVPRKCPVLVYKVIITAVRTGEKPPWYVCPVNGGNNLFKSRQHVAMEHWEVNSYVAGCRYMSTWRKGSWI